MRNPRSLPSPDLGVRFAASTYTFTENEVAVSIEVVRVGEAGVPFSVLVQGGKSSGNTLRQLEDN